MSAHNWIFSTTRRRLLTRLCLLFAICCSSAGAQIASPWVNTQPLAVDSGTTGLKLTLRRLHTTARLMHTVAHPDDEDGGMLTLESRGHGDSVLQLTLNRGEGGQNIVGSNLLDELGILRTLELLAADRYYGVEQRFTHVADFGFSKTPEETFEKWGGHDVALADMVRVIRTFRPDVICTRFQGSSRDGHGNHQASGILTREAFRAAADPNRFPEQIREGLEPWQAKKLYMDNVRGTEDWTIQLETSQDDPLLGESYVQFAWQGLKHQLSQGAGNWQLSNGRRTSYYKLIDSVLPALPTGAHEKDFFDGVDTSLPALANRVSAKNRAPWLRPQLEAIAHDVDIATAVVDKGDQSPAMPLLRGLDQTRALIERVKGSDLPAMEKADLLANLETKQEQFQQAANLALAVSLEAGPGTPDGRPLAQSFSTGDGDVLGAVITAGKPFVLMVKLHNGSTLPMDLKRLALVVPQGWKSELFMDRVPRQIAAGDGVAVTFRVTPPADAELTKPYFHRDNPEADAIYKVDEPKYETQALPPPPVSARADYSVGDVSGEIVAVARTPMHYVSGQAWTMPMAVVPPFSVEPSPESQIIPAASNPADKMSVVIRSTETHASGTVNAQVPQGWNREPSSQALEFTSPGAKTAEFKILPDGAREARYKVSATFRSGSEDFREGYALITRPDIGGFFYYQPAIQRESVVEVKIPVHLKLGYIMGAGDGIPTALEQVGLNVTLLTPSDVEKGDLSRFGTIVVGIRAYDTRPDVKKNNARLLDYVRNGGTLVVQYNTSPEDFNQGNYLPYPATLSHDRVTKEEAPVTILDPASPVFHYPNQIQASDFNGWVQERGLYFMDSWDKQYAPLLACNDPGEQAQKGGLLLAKYGKGYYIYSAYAFFRQLPSGVPGAIRLYVNLLSVGHEPR